MSEIPGWFDWADLYDAFVERAEDGASVVECGTFFGKSAHYLASKILASGKRITFDTWDNWYGVPPEYALGYPGWTGSEVLREQTTRATLAGLPVTLRTGDAIDAAKEYEDASLDLVFLDDDHSADHVSAECAAWWAKVKHGGLLAGHDVDWPSEREGIERFSVAQRVPILEVSEHCWVFVKGTYQPTQADLAFKHRAYGHGKRHRY